MSIAITEEHRALAQTVSDFLAKHQSRAAARALLEAEAEPLPAFWAELAGLGLLGLHIPADHGGSGFGLSETLVVAEQMGRQLAPGPFVPTVIASAVLAGALEADAVRPAPRPPGWRSGCCRASRTAAWSARSPSAVTRRSPTAGSPGTPGW